MWNNDKGKEEVPSKRHHPAPPPAHKRLVSEAESLINQVYCDEDSQEDKESELVWLKGFRGRRLTPTEVNELKTRIEQLKEDLRESVILSPGELSIPYSPSSTSRSSTSQSEPTTPKPTLLQTGDMNLTFAEEGAELKGQFSGNKIVGVEQHYYAPATPKTLSDLNPWGIFPKESPHFVERPLIIDEITKQLEQSEKSIVLSALHGLGGIGKTQLATYYARSQAAQERYPFRAWFNAENETTLQLSYISLGQRAGIIDEKSTLEEKVEQVKQWLSHSKNRGWLLVFDNALNYGSLTPYVPSEGGKVLITSRNETWNIPRIPIPLFTKEEARELMLRQSGCPAEEPALTDLIEELGYLPLALAQAAAYIKMKLSHQKAPIATYLERYRECKAAWLKANPLRDVSMLGDKAPLSVSLTFEMNFDALSNTSSVSLTLLFHCALLASDAIPMDILKESIGNQADGQAPESETPFNNGLNGLKQYSLLQVDTQGQTVSLHRLLKVLLMERFDEHSLKERQEMWAKVTDGLIENYQQRNQSIEEIQRRTPLMPHLQALLPIFDSLTTADETEAVSPTTSSSSSNSSLLSETNKASFELKGADLLFWIGHVHYCIFQESKQAKPLLARALAIQEKHLGSEHPSLGTTLSNLGEACRAVGEYQEAITLHKRALAIQEKHLGNEHPTLGTMLSNLGIAYRDVGKYQEAIALHKRALNIKEKHLGNEHPDLGIMLSNLGETCRAVGEYQEAITLHKRALTILEKHLGAEHPSLGTTLSNLGAVCRAVGQYQQAIALTERALGIKEKHLGAEHPDLAITLSNLGEAYREVGEYQEAITLHKRALAIEEKHFGSEHSSLAATLSNLGVAYDEVGEYQEAITLHKRALAIEEKHFGSEHPSLATMLSNLGVAYDEVGEYQEAITLHKRALAVQEKHLGSEHPDLGTMLNNLGIACRAVGEYQEAITLHKRALAIKEKHFGSEHPSLGATLSNLGVAYDEVGEYQEAITLHKRALAIKEKHFGSEHPSLATTLGNLGSAHRDVGEHQEAITLHKRALAIQEKHLGSEHPSLATTLSNLGNAYYTVGQYQAAITFYKRALAIQEKHLGNEHPTLGTILSNLGIAYHAVGQYQAAITLHKRALAIQEKHLGSEHPSLATTLSNLGEACRAVGEYQEAITLHKYALTIAEKYLGVDHPNTATIRNNLAAAVHIQMDSFDQSRTISVDPNVIARLKASFPTPFTGADETLTELARLMQLLAGTKRKDSKLHTLLANKFFKLNHPIYAIYYYEQAIALSDTSDAYRYLAWCYHVQGEIDKAQACFKTGTSKVPAPDTYIEYAHFLYIQENYPDRLALAYIGKALAMPEVAEAAVSYGAMEANFIESGLRIFLEQQQTQGQADMTLPVFVLAYYLALRCYQKLEKKQEQFKSLVYLYASIWQSDQRKSIAPLVVIAEQSPETLAVFQAQMNDNNKAAVEKTEQHSGAITDTATPQEQQHTSDYSQSGLVSQFSEIVVSNEPGSSLATEEEEREDACLSNDDQINRL